MRSLFVAAVVLLAAPSAAAAAGDLEPVECWFDIPAGRQAQCAWLHPGERVGERAVRLPVVRLPGSDPDRTPVVHVPGGPGYPGGVDRASMAGWWRWRERAGWDGDLIVYDPRGTGMSRPAIRCPGIREADRNGLARELSGAMDLYRTRRAARDCYRRLGGEPYLSAFNSAAQVRDLGVLLEALEGPAFLWGVSYGTRLALHAAREHETAIAGLLLDSVFPPAIDGFLARPAQFDRALDEIAAACVTRAGCDHPPTRVRTAIRALLTRAEREPPRLTLPRPSGGGTLDLVVTDYRLLWMLFFGAYAIGDGGDVADAVVRAARDDAGALAPLARRYVATLLDPAFSPPVYFSVTCPEDAPPVTRDAWQAALRAHPRVAPYLRPESEYDVCGFWDAGRLPAAYREPASTPLPVLLLHGARDPATLPEWAARLAHRLPEARALLFRDAGHTVTFTDACAMAAADAFQASPRAWSPPACLGKRLQAAYP